MTWTWKLNRYEAAPAEGVLLVVRLYQVGHPKHRRTWWEFRGYLPGKKPLGGAERYPDAGTAKGAAEAAYEKSTGA